MVIVDTPRIGVPHIIVANAPTALDLEDRQVLVIHSHLQRNLDGLEAPRTEVLNQNTHASGGPYALIGLREFQVAGDLTKRFSIDSGERSFELPSSRRTHRLPEELRDVDLHLQHAPPPRNP